MKDFRKGLELFFDSLELVWAARPEAHIRVWIIGGSWAEVSFAAQSANSRLHLAEQARRDAVTFWGRIDHDSLPEFYSRSTVVVVPSFREQFGMVAAEAMMCGTPVVAARVGGLQDVVISGHTGMLFDPGNPGALAACILSYLNVPELSAWHGANARVWAEPRFASARVLPVMEAILTSAESRAPADSMDTSDAAFLERSIGELSATVGRLLGRIVSSCRNLTSSHSVSFHVALADGGSVFVKQYSRRPPSLHTIYGDTAKPRLRDPALYRLDFMSGLSDVTYVPTVIARDDEKGMIVQQWFDVAPPLSFDEARRILSDLQEEVAATELLPQSALDAFTEAVTSLAPTGQLMTREIQEQFDLLGAMLHAPLVNGVSACRRMHPQVELFRIARFLEQNRVWLPPNYTVRALAEAHRLLARKPFLPRRPRLAHGSLKAEHILTDGTRYFLCDFDQMGYYVGPVDTAHWLWEYFERQPETARESILIDVLHALICDDEERYFAVCWLLALLLNKDLVFVMRGEWERLDASMRALWTFGDTVRSLESFG